MTQITIAKILTKLCLIMNAERSELQLATMAGYLSKFFTCEEVSKASEYILQRNKFFPSVADYFSILKPSNTIEQSAIMAVEGLKSKVISHNNWVELKPKLDEHEKSFVSIVGYANILSIHKLEAVKIFETILNKPEFYLGKEKEEEHELLEG